MHERYGDPELGQFFLSLETLFVTTDEIIVLITRKSIIVERVDTERGTLFTIYPLSRLKHFLQFLVVLTTARKYFKRLRLRIVDATAVSRPSSMRKRGRWPLGWGRGGKIENKYAKQRG